MGTKKTSKKVLGIRKDFDDVFLSLYDIEIERAVKKYIDSFEDETSIQKYHKKFMEKAKNEETKYKDYSKFEVLVNSLKAPEKAPVVAPKIIQEVKPVSTLEDDDFFRASNRIEALMIFEQNEDKN
jgi:LPS O-antigen subunit length determinant protein (WzzB/FepE family)